MAVDDNVLEGLQEDTERGVFIFGTDVSKIPCFKNSFLNGIYAGFGTGIATFLATSNAIRSTNFSVIAFTLVTYGYWLQCRMNWAHDNFNSRQSENSFIDEIEANQERIRKKAESYMK